MRRIIVTVLTAILCLATAKAQEKKDYLIKPLPHHWSCDSLFEQTMPSEDMWWHRFEDGQLDSLISIATRNNYSVSVAMENMRIAKATWHTTRAGLLPKLDLNTGWQRSRTSGNVAYTGNQKSYEGYYNATISMSWQIDLFGSIYMRAKAQKALFHASEEEYKAVMTSLCANVAKNYFSLKQNLAQMQVLQENAASQKEIMNLVEVRYNTGLASKLDVSQARSVYYSTIASIPSTEAAIEQYRNEIAVLLGIYPEEARSMLTENSTLPHNVDPIAIGVPAGLLRRRPDVRNAEREVEAYAALLGAAKRDWLPTFYLNGSIGFSSTRLNELAKSESNTWEISPTMTFNLFDGGKSVNATIEARAKLEQSIINFNSTVLTAVQEVENAIAAYRSSIKQIGALRETVNQNRETLRLSLDLYRQGLTQFQNVLDAQRTLLNYQNYLVQAQGNSLISLIQLYEALGGGW